MRDQVDVGILIRLEGMFPPDPGEFLVPGPWIDDVVFHAEMAADPARNVDVVAVDAGKALGHAFELHTGGEQRCKKGSGVKSRGEGKIDRTGTSGDRSGDFCQVRAEMVLRLIERSGRSDR